MICPKCNAEVGQSHAFCPFCGATLPITQSSTPLTVPAAPVAAESPNTSGLGDTADVPEEIKGWSWAAFLWNWIWAIGNNVWIGLLCFIPYVGFIMTIVLGIKGNQWAWQKKHWQSVEDFKKDQRNWVKWWFIIFVLGTITSVVILITTQALFGVRSDTFNISTP